MKDLAVTLKNDKVILKPLALSDEEMLWQVAQDKDLHVYGLKNLSDRAIFHKYVVSAIKDMEDGHCSVWLIIDAVSGKIAGCTRLAEINWNDERGQIGWTWIGKEFQGTGLNKAMKYEILRYGFETLGLNRIELKADERNTRSRKAILKLGATEEGTLRQHMKIHDGYIRNTVFYSILKAEWPLIKQNLER